MKKIILAALLMLVAASSELAAQQAGQFGVGVIAGDPLGLTAKYWLGESQAIDGGVGFGDDYSFYADFLWHLWNLFPQPKQGKLGAYVGLGGLIKADSDEDPSFGIRTLVGIDYWIQNHPIELFAELGPLFNVTPDTDVDLDGGVGVRFYFGGSAAANAPKKS